MTWSISRTIVFVDAYLPNKGIVSRTITIWASTSSPCRPRRILWEFDDMPGFFFPELAANGGYVPYADRVNGGLYRWYVGANGHSKCATKLPTNRFGLHRIPEASKSKTKHNGVTSLLCFLCVVLGSDVAKVANYSLFGIDKTVCGGCQSKIGAVRTLQAPCQRCFDKQANYPQFVDGAGKAYFYCFGCFKLVHKVKPSSQEPGKCDCSEQRCFNAFAVCCFAALPLRSVSKSTCVRRLMKDGKEELQLCNKMMGDTQVTYSLRHLPDEYPHCPGCLRAVRNESVKHEDEWRAAVRLLMQEEMGEEYVSSDEEVTFGKAALNATCLASVFGGGEKKWRRVDFLLCLLCFAIVMELDQDGHRYYKCDHNSQFNQHIFDCLRELKGALYDLYSIRVNPDGKVENGRRVSSASDRGVAVSARVTVDALLKLLEHAKERKDRRDAGEDLPGKCFIVHFFYEDGLQLDNEVALCRGRAAEFEMLQFE